MRVAGEMKERASHAQEISKVSLVKELSSKEAHEKHEE
jgi:hypothetical protein